MPATDTPKPRIVLDTNVLLDWLVFADPRVEAVVQAVTAGTLQWVVCASMRTEFERTLGYDNLSRWRPDARSALAVFDQHAHLCPAPATLPALRCRDADDQVFLDLAVASGARWLLSQDRALLALARGARRLGVQILRPQEWSMPD